MLRNYFKTALRNLWKNKGFSAINIIGLAVGLATCLLIMIYVMDELSYDQYNERADRIVRLNSDIKFNGTHFDLATAPPLAGPSIVQDYPEVAAQTRMHWANKLLIRKGDINIQETRIVYADSSLFDVFTLPLVAGDTKTALTQPRSIVISEKMARKYFDATDVVGRSLLVNDSIHYKVTGVMKNIPGQSHFHFDFFLPMLEDRNSRATDQWLSNNYNTYLLLKPGADYRKLQPKLDQMIVKYIEPLLRSVVNQSLDEFHKSGNNIFFSLVPLTSIHLHGETSSELEANGSIQYVYIFSAVATFILLIACVNFMNLSTARSSNRAKEVGVRKVLGSLRGHLISQFITESVLISFISMLLALGLAWLFLPTFNHMAAKEMMLGLFTRPWLLPGMIMLVLVVGLLAGSYPAFYLSAFNPIAVLKGNLAAGFRTGWLRNSLVVFQFGISIFLMVGTVVIYNQMNYIRSKKLGFNRDHILVLQNIYPLGTNIRAFKEDILKMPGVQGASLSWYMPTGENQNDNTYFLSPDMDVKKAMNMQNWVIDDQYVPVLGMEMAAGRNFSKEFKSDSDAVVLNETAAAAMGMRIGKSQVIGEKIYDMLDVNSKQLRPYKVIGVVKNFNYRSLRQAIGPMILFLGKDEGNMALRINSGNIPQLISQIERKYNSMGPGQPFKYSFMSEDFDAIYKTEQRTGSISLSFSLLAICIACLGLFGLAAYAAEQRTREIGIRKVLGASVPNIIGLLSKDFLRLVIVAALISFPFAWWAMHTWLQDFAFRVGISWTVFALAGVMAAGIALVTVSSQAIRAAFMNPVRSLKTE